MGDLDATILDLFRFWNLLEDALALTAIRLLAPVDLPEPKCLSALQPGLLYWRRSSPVKRMSNYK